MKQFLLFSLLLLLSVGGAFSQQVYFKLGFGHKTDFSKTSFLGRTGYIQAFDDGFDFESNSINSVFTGFNFLLNVGYLLQNKDRVEIGVSQDESKVGFDVYSNGANLNSVNAYTKREKTLLANNKLLAFQCKYFARIGKTNSYLISGLQLSLSKEYRGDRYMERINYDSETVINMYEYPRANKANNLFLTLGFEHNLTIKKTYWFSVSVVGNLAITNNVLSYRNATIAVKQGNDRSYYSFESTSKGSGVFIQIARAFSFGKG
jgi:hypothetical protein